MICVLFLFYRQAWALVSEVGGTNASCREDVREHENHDTGGRALARRNFTTIDGVAFSVTAYSEWKNGEETAGQTLFIGWKLQNYLSAIF